jgi:YbbR domain-containing protein
MAQSRHFVGGLFTKNKGIKLLALLLASISWLSIRAVIGVTNVMHGIPLEIKVQRDGLSVLEQSEKTVTVTFKGTHQDLARLEEARVRSKLRAVVHARAKDPTGKEIITIRPRHIMGARGVRVEKVIPGTVDVHFDEESERIFLVNVATIGELASGNITSVVCDPMSVTVKGPKRELDKLPQADGRFIATEPIDISEISQSLTKSVRVLPPSHRWVPVIDPPEVVVSVTIERQVQSTREWQDIPIRAMIGTSATVGVEVRPMKVVVVLTGRKDVLDSLSENDFSVFVDCNGLDLAVTYDDVQLSVHMPPEIDVTAEVKPPSVQVALKEVL